MGRDGKSHLRSVTCPHRAEYADRIKAGKRLGGAMTEVDIDTKRQAFFTPDSLACYLQVSDRMIRKWVAEGRLRSYKLDGCRRFDPADVDSFVSQFQDERVAAVS